MLKRAFVRGRRVYFYGSPSYWTRLANPRGVSSDEEVYDMAEGFLRRRKVESAGGGKGRSRVTPEDRAHFPALVEFLTACAWEDGTERRPGTALIFCDDGRLKVCLADREQEIVLFLAVESLFVALEACDDALQAEDGDWRPSKNTKPARR